jgi:DNA polymerase-3 subunit epsilon
VRQIILDTETTGLEPERGHRIIEIGCVEMVNRRLTGEQFHEYLDPERDIDKGASDVHGLTREKLAGRPKFADVVERLLEFVDGAELVIHNAPFDTGFLDMELVRWAQARGEPAQGIRAHCGVLDTLALARELHPGQRNSLDALCKRYAIDNSHRQLHGALLDARILADVYLAMTGGQSTLALDEAVRAIGIVGDAVAGAQARPAGVLRVVESSVAERAAHEAMLAVLGKSCGKTVSW